MNENTMLAEQAESGTQRVLTYMSYAAFFLFVLLADMMIFWPSYPLLPAGLIALTVTAGAALTAFDGRATLRLLFRPPLLFFTLFLLLGLAVWPFSINRFRALYYAVGYGGLLLFAVALARHFAFHRLLDLLRIALGLGIVLSVATHVSGIYNGFVMHNGDFIDRFSGWYMNPNPMAVICALFLLLTLVELMETAPRERSRRLLVMFPVAFLAVTILWYAQSRTVWLALTGAIGSFFLLRVMKSKRTPLRHRVPAWFWLVLLLVPAAAFVTLHARLQMGSGLLSMDSRTHCWVFAVTKIERRPWSGYGLGSVHDVLARYPDPLMRCGVHNAYIEAALYAGVAGGILFLLFMAGLTARAMLLYWRDDRRLALLLLSVFYLIFALPSPIILGRPMSATLLVLLLGAAASLPEETAREPGV